MIKCARHPYCDREFEEKSGRGRKQIYCSHRCGNLAWHQRAKLTKPVDWPEEIRGMDMDYWWTDPLADELGDE